MGAIAYPLRIVMLRFIIFSKSSYPYIALVFLLTQIASFLSLLVFAFDFTGLKNVWQSLAQSIYLKLKQ